MKAHATALIDPSARIADDVEIGAYCVVGPAVRIGPGCRLLPRVTLGGSIDIGRANVFHPNVVIGHMLPPGSDPRPGGRIEIGDENVFREGTSVNPPAGAGGTTRIGSRNRFHPCSNVGHDCTLGDGIVLGSFGALWGRTVVGDRAWLEGSGGTSEEVTLGRGAWIQSHCTATVDVPPFVGVGGDEAEVRALNPFFRTPSLERAFEIVWRSGLLRAEACQRLEREKDPEVVELLDFLRRAPREAPDE